MELEGTNDYIDDTTKAGNLRGGRDIGNIIAMAILEADGHHEAAIEAIERASRELLELPGGKEAAECFAGAVEAIENWEPG